MWRTDRRGVLRYQKVIVHHFALAEGCTPSFRTAEVQWVLAAKHHPGFLNPACFNKKTDRGSTASTLSVWIPRVLCEQF